ncbi:MAG: tryptophan synthase subunit alpha [Nitrococcus sp.]|nr:tryptophan synthase subunit alpha [Nitrococcus sp.]
MSRIERRFAYCRERGRKALIPYITGGDPQPAVTVPLMQVLVEAGADIIEVGIPFSDPMADGRIIQAACERALAHRVNIRRVLEMVGEFRAGDAHTPVVLMGYLNPIEQMGYGVFAREAAAAGVDGVLCVDLPPEESQDLVQALQASGLDPIWLIAPTTRVERIERICQAARGFIYYVSLKGVTGADSLDVDDVAAHVARIRAVTQLPVGVGFGIRDAAAAARIAAVADAVVVGSAIVARIEAHQNEPRALYGTVRELLGAMRRAMDTSVTETA